MQITRLSLHQYRNIESEEIEFSPSTNFLFGDNGHGKTNVLEAVYCLAYGKSFRAGQPREQIMHGAGECWIRGLMSHAGVEKELQVCITPGEKRLLIHRKAVPLDQFVGNLHVLAFTSDHLKVVRGSPADRRSFMDRAMLTLYPGHLKDLASYSRAVRQRNGLLAQALREGRRPDDNMLSSWDLKLSEEGGRILNRRWQFVEAMKKELPEGLFGGDKFGIRYVSTVRGESRDPGSLREAFLEKLTERRKSDEQSCATSVGPHRDDLKLLLQGRSLAAYGSAGQQRSCLLNLYIAQMEIHLKHHGYYPVFLIDDVEAELDPGRIEDLTCFVSGRAQSLITTAKETVVPSLAAGGRRILVRNGRLHPDKNH